MDANLTPVAAAHDLAKNFGTKQALNKVNFTIAPGEMVALLGPNGAGKSTLIGCLLGFLLPTSGQARLFGQPAETLTPALRASTGFVPQKMTGFSPFRVGELLTYIGKFYATPPGPPPAWLLDWADLDMKARIKNLSGGQRQRLSILLALRHEPDLLILDEPVASLDPQARRDFMQLLKTYCTSSGRSIVISSHILSDLEKIASRAIFMRRGRVVHDTPMDRFREKVRWVTAPRDALPETLTVLGEADGALLVDGWTETLHQTIGPHITTQVPDLETAFLEITR
jgi:ABC-2 type transport system ATP-binding protein